MTKQNAPFLGLVPSFVIRIPCCIGLDDYEIAVSCVAKNQNENTERHHTLDTETLRQRSVESTLNWMQHEEESPSEYESFRRDGDRMDEDAIVANRILMGAFSLSFSTTPYEAQVHELQALVDTLQDQVKNLESKVSTLESDLEICEIALLESKLERRGATTSFPQTASPVIQPYMPTTTMTESPMASIQSTDEPSIESTPEPSQDFRPWTRPAS